MARPNPAILEPPVKGAVARILRAYRTKIRRHTKPGTSFNIWPILRCTELELVRHIQTRFKPGMSWDNYGEKWVLRNRLAPISADCEPKEFYTYFHHSSYEPSPKECSTPPVLRSGKVARRAK